MKIDIILHNKRASVVFTSENGEQHTLEVIADKNFFFKEVEGKQKLFGDSDEPTGISAVSVEQTEEEARAFWKYLIEYKFEVVELDENDRQNDNSVRVLDPSTLGLE